MCIRETSRLAGEGDIPYYPIRLAADQRTLRRYLDAARSASGVTFAGRLGTYRYLDMDVTIAEALATADRILAGIDSGGRIPSLCVDVDGA